MIDVDQLDAERFSRAVTMALKQREMSQHDLARAIGTKQPTVSDWLSMKKRPSLANIRKALAALGIPWEDVRAVPGRGDGAPASKSTQRGPYPAVIMVPRGGFAAAGHGAYNGEGDEPEYDPYPRDELQRIANAPAERMRSLTVIGDSLAPEIPPNTRVIYMPMERFLGDGLYVLEMDGMTVVKRVQYLSGGGLDLLPINIDYQPDRLLPVPEAGEENTFRSNLSGLTTRVRCIGKVVFYPKPA